MTTNAAKVISIAIFLLLMQGCKITQVVPANGAIVSRTGNYDCPTGQTCVIDVVNGSVFSDTFTAAPNAGYRFAGWKKQNGYLCGGNKTPCALENVPASFTAVDADTFLEPIFEKIDLLKFLPATTRGVFQIDPGAPGAMDTSVTSTAWGSGPLQILQQYSAGMAIAEQRAAPGAGTDIRQPRSVSPAGHSEQLKCRDIVSRHRPYRCWRVPRLSALVY